MPRETEIQIRYDKINKMYVAVAPGLNYCTAFGETPEEARANFDLARSLWFDAEGRPLCGPDCCGQDSSS